MKITEALFAGSSTRISEKPKQKFPEFAFIGRSNVGKSSLINMLCNNKKLAMTSAKPGKTRLVNHFLINRKWYLVDLPGYGYAKMSATAKQKLEQVIRNYLNLSQEMTMLFVLIDSRHEIGKIDMDFLIELGQSRIPFAIIFTKADKSGKEKLATQIENNKKQILEYWEELPPVFISSSETGLGREEILDYIGTVLESVEEENQHPQI
ncbi:MAG: ribosome biogenesis GTP-binding protein YihA/YsxC [Bacteroidales bacterium]|nr:ribosome biogenesis GTP-binding protein YihA/YsxC [Bacteroidales bacterium]